MEIPNRAIVVKKKQQKFKPVSIAEDAQETEVWVLFMKLSHTEREWSERIVGAYDSKVNKFMTGWRVNNVTCLQELAAKAVTMYFDKDDSHIAQAWRDMDEEEYHKYFVCYSAEKLAITDTLQTIVAYKRGEEAVKFEVKMVKKNLEVGPINDEVFDEEEGDCERTNDSLFEEEVMKF